VDMTRSTLYILVPLSVILALLLVSQGVVQTFSPYPKATVLQPAAAIARAAIDQAHQFITTQSTGKPEKQAIDCELITPANAGQFGVFARKQ